jgi:hypothetical protein
LTASNESFVVIRSSWETLGDTRPTAALEWDRLLFAQAGLGLFSFSFSCFQSDNLIRGAEQLFPLLSGRLALRLGLNPFLRSDNSPKQLKVKDGPFQEF